MKGKFWIGFLIFLMTGRPFFLAGSADAHSVTALDRELHQTELKIAIEKQRGIVEQSQFEVEKLEHELEAAQKALQNAEEKLKGIEFKEQNRGLYYKDVEGNPLTSSGHFHDQALYGKKAAEDHLKQTQKAYQRALVKLKNEKRLFLEAAQRLKEDDEEAKA